MFSGHESIAAAEKLLLAGAIIGHKRIRPQLLCAFWWNGDHYLKGGHTYCRGECVWETSGLRVIATTQWSDSGDLILSGKVRSHSAQRQGLRHGNVTELNSEVNQVSLFNPRLKTNSQLPRAVRLHHATPDRAARRKGGGTVI